MRTAWPRPSVSLAEPDDGAAERAQNEREELSAKLRQGQKLETVGMLAGGIAHDFNNILAAVLGHASLLEGEVIDADARRRVRAIVGTPGTAAFRLRALDENPGARSRDGFHHGLLDRQF